MYRIGLILYFLHYKRRELPRTPFLYVIDNISNTFVPFMSKVFNISINFIYKNHKNNKLHLAPSQYHQNYYLKTMIFQMAFILDELMACCGYADTWLTICMFRSLKTTLSLVNKKIYKVRNNERIPFFQLKESFSSWDLL